MQRERLTITIEPELIRAIDETINKQTVRNRSHAIEALIKKGLAIDSLNQAFIFLRQGWSYEKLAETINMLQKINIKKIYYCNQSQTSVTSNQIKTNTETEEISNAFGSGGALLLKKEELKSQFITIFLDQNTNLNQNLLSALSFHLANKPLSTHLINTENTINLKWSGFNISEPEITNYIKMGVSELDQAVFPDLHENNKLKTYVQ